MKSRLDKVMVERGLAASRERAQALILAGRVLVNEQKVDKPGAQVAEDVAIRLLGEDLRYVSRGGLKLEHALQTWAIEVKGMTCADIGASTGGFTDCMLQRGAACVVAVDTGFGQMAHKLRVDARVKLMERKNARLLDGGELRRFAGGVRFVSSGSAVAVLAKVVPHAVCFPRSTLGRRPDGRNRRRSLRAHRRCLQAALHRQRHYRPDEQGRP